MATTKLSIDDLPPELQKGLRKRLGIPSERTVKFTMEDVRSYALGVLAVIKGLTQSQRERVLNQSIKINKV